MPAGGGANRIGLNVQAEDFDFGRSFTEVINRDNDLDLDSQDLPVPAAAEVIEVIPDR